MPLILPWQGVLPTIDPTAWIAPNATITGDVVLGTEASVWFNVVIRGDVHEIRIGARTNVQDNTVVHATKDRHGTYIGADVTIGHSAVLHACILEDASFVGMGAIVLDEAVVERHAMLAAGALLTSGKRVPSGELWAGNPAKKLRDLTDGERAAIDASALRYVEYTAGYR